MQETKNNQLFTEISSEESATINGGHGYYRRRYQSVSYRPYYRRRVRYSSRRRYYDCY
ncbi:MAG: hypothetical protein WBA93_05155 [Microcoleaceae cyanobacterium]